ncbi:unnamed protein product [Calypogeia fissa]
MSSSVDRENHEGKRNGNVEEEAEKELSAQMLKAGAERLKGEPGVRVAGWTIRTKKCTILKMDEVERWEKKLQTTHLPEMVFGDSALELLHEASGIKIHFNPFDALLGWKKESLPPVEVPAAVKWKFRSRPSQQVILDYDYTFTTPYCGSETIERNVQTASVQGRLSDALEKNVEAGAATSLAWVECEDRIDMVALQARDPILFYDEVVLYEDELADNGISLLTVKVRVMPTCWFLLLRFWLRVDGVLMRLRDTRMFSAFRSDAKVPPVVLRERWMKEDTFQALVSRGCPSDSAAYAEPSAIGDFLQTKSHVHEKLVLT